MAQLVVRQIGDDLKEKLRGRAARTSRSLEAEVRAILTEAAASEDVAEASRTGFGRRMAALFKDTGFTRDEVEALDAEIERKRRTSSFGA